MDAASAKNFPLTGANILEFGLINSRQDLNDDNIDNLRDKLLKSALPFTQSFYTLGLESTR